jgi:uncharacterized membrane protein
MIYRPLLTALVLVLPILVLTFAVLLGASSLTGAMGDAAGSYGLFWCAMAALVLLTIDALLLLMVLGIRAIDQREELNRQDEDRQDEDRQDEDRP